MIRTIIAIIFVLSQSAPAHAQGTDNVSILSVCEVMNDLLLHNGQTVIVVGRFGRSDEGSWLDQDWSTKPIVNGLEWHASIALVDMMPSAEPPPTPKHFRWDTQLLLSKLMEVKPTTTLQTFKHCSDKWAAIYGRLETRPLRYRYDGFGHLGGSPARLIFPQNGIYYFPRRYLKPKTELKLGE